MSYSQKLEKIAMCFAALLCVVVATKNSNAKTTQAKDPFAHSILIESDAQNEKPSTYRRAKQKEWYFLTGALSSSSQNWYAKHLSAAQEKPIYLNKHSIHFRFIWLRTFHAPFIFHIKGKAGGPFTLMIIKLTGKGGYEPGSIEFRKSQKITKQQIEELRALLIKIKFNELPTMVESFGLDGSQWIVEVLDENQYHVVDRWGGGNIRSVGKWFMQISKTDISGEESY